MKFVIKHIPAPPRTHQTAFLAIVTVLLVHSTALATPNDAPSWRLFYTRATNAPTNCPSETELRGALAAKLDGNDPFQNDAPRAITVELTPKANDIEVHILTRDEKGTTAAIRTLTMQSWRCDLLTERIAFELRDIVDPMQLPQAEPPPIPIPVQPPTPVPLPDTPPTRNTPTPATPSLGAIPSPQRLSNIPKLALSFGIGAAWWNAPEAALSTVIGAEARWPHFALGIEGQYDHAWTLLHLDGWRAERVGALLMACVNPLWSKIFFARACGFGAVAQLSADNQKIHSVSNAQMIVDIGTRFGAGVWIRPSVGLELRADVAYVLRRGGVREGPNEHWQPAPFTGALRLAFVGVFDVFAAK